MTPEQIREAVRVFDAVLAIEDAKGLERNPTEATIYAAALAYADVLERTEYRVVDKDGLIIGDGIDSPTEADGLRASSDWRRAAYQPHRVEVRVVGEWRPVGESVTEGETPSFPAAPGWENTPRVTGRIRHG